MITKKTVSNRMNDKLDKIHTLMIENNTDIKWLKEKVSIIETQVKLTNGRVTILETIKEDYLKRDEFNNYKADVKSDELSEAKKKIGSITGGKVKLWTALISGLILIIIALINYVK